MGDRIARFFTSLRLTVVCIGFAVVLVFLGTLAQVDEGLYLAQARWFKSFFVWWGPEHAGWQIPIFPGGYLIGGTLLLNLIAAHIKRFQLSWKKAGIQLTHAGVILLLIGQLSTDLFSHETQLQFFEGQTKQFTESGLRDELVFMTDASAAGEDDVISIPAKLLLKQKEIMDSRLPCTVRLRDYYPNSALGQRGPMVDKDPPPSTQGTGLQLVLKSLPETRDMESHNFPSAVIELVTRQGSQGTWLVSTDLQEPQEISLGGRIWRIALRPERHYLPYTMQLLKATHETYPGTDKPKNYQSRVRIENPARGENREVDIYMNNPLRYEGLTFYQSQMSRVEVVVNRSSTLQVVRNPAWLTPYAGCAMVGGGMLTQFLMHLIGFITKKRTSK